MGFRSIVFCITLLFIAVFAKAQIGIEWMRHSVNSFNSGSSVIDGITDKSGNSYIYCYGTHDTSSNYGNFLFKYDKEGILLWSKQYPYKDLNWHCRGNVLADANGNLYFTAFKNWDYDMHIVKLDSEGNVVQEKFLGFDLFGNMIQLPDGDISLSLENYKPGYERSFLRFDTSLTIVSQINTNSTEEYCWKHCYDSEGNVYSGHSDVLKKIDASGNTVWNAVFGYQPYTHVSYMEMKDDALYLVSSDSYLHSRLLRYNIQDGVLTKVLYLDKALGEILLDEQGDVFCALNDGYENGSNTFTIRKYSRDFILKYEFSTPQLNNHPYFGDIGHMHLNDTDNTLSFVSSRYLHFDSVINRRFFSMLTLDSTGSLTDSSSWYMPYKWSGYWFLYADSLNDLYAHIIFDDGTFGLMKYCMNCHSANVSGVAYFDKNLNCQIDSNEQKLSNRLIILEPDGFYCFTNADGNYSFEVADGPHTISEVLPNNYWQLACDSVHHIVIDSNSAAVVSRDFANYAPQTINDLTVNAAASPVRPGFNCTFTLAYLNNGTTNQNAEVALKLDSIFTFVSSSDTPVFISGDSMVWDVGMLQTNHGGVIGVQCVVSTLAQLDSFYNNTAYIFPDTADANVADNQYVLTEVITGSFDPNEKLVYPASLRYDDTLTTNKLEYQINFQNTGTDTAFTVVVRDAIEHNLDPGTFRMLASSHPYNLRIVDKRTLEWTFSNILLPDSNTNEPASHGFVKFAIDARPNVAYKSREIKNAAAIYFDYNVPVITDTATIVQKGKVKPVDTTASSHDWTFRIYPNPTSGEVTITYSLGADGNVGFDLFDVTGRLLATKELSAQSAGEHTIAMNALHTLPAGIYSLQLRTSHTTASRRVVILR